MTMDAVPFDHDRPLAASPPLILPDASRIFLDRTRRFAALAQGHSLAGWLSFLGRLTGLQHDLLQAYPSLPAPDDAAPAPALEHGVSPIMDPFGPRDPSWRQALAALARELAPYAPPPARKDLERLQAMDAPALEALADRVLRVKLDRGEVGFLTFVVAALQVYWTALAARLDRSVIASPLRAPAVCPCCGSPPVAAVVRTDSQPAKLRYLHCALCNTAWHMPRVTCAACGDSNRVAYYHIAGSDESVRAETCDACRSYLKCVYREKSPQADPIADDLSTLALDLLVEEAGYHRMSPNLLFAPYSPDRIAMK